MPSFEYVCIAVTIKFVYRPPMVSKTIQFPTLKSNGTQALKLTGAVNIVNGRNLD
jgi:hypothetical protein